MSDPKSPLINILHLTDFSPCSDAALRWAIDITRANSSTLSLHVVVPDALTDLTPVSPAAELELKENLERREMQRIDQQLAGLPHAHLHFGMLSEQVQEIRHGWTVSAAD